MKTFFASLAGTLAALALVIGLGLWRLLAWWNTPLGEPLEIEKGLGLLAQLGPDYKWFWALAGLPFLAVLIWIAAALGRIAAALGR